MSEDSSSQHGSGDSDHTLSEEPQSSAVELTDPHLPVLSKFWLAALKDKAYLFLPAEFGNQLPPSGGTFYSVDVMDSVRPYYEANWSSLLHAAAMWLQERGFQEMKVGDEVGGSDSGGGNAAGLPVPLLSDTSGSSSFAPPPPPITSDPRVMNFHLVLGLSVQSLCSPATLDHPHVLSSCLRALQRLLTSDVAFDVISSDSRFAVELLSMLHRLLLTCQVPSIHVVSLHIAILVGNILGRAVVQTPVPRAVDKEEGATTNEPSASSAVKEVESGKVPVSLEESIKPGTSCTCSLLEVVSCCLLRLVPSLKQAEYQQRPSSSSPPASSSANLPSKDSLTIILLCLKILSVPCGLCAPEATPTVLPSVLHLQLSTLGYVSTLSQHALKEVPRLPAVALQSLSQVCTALPMSHDVAGPELGEILQSALTSVLGGYVGGFKGEDALGISDESRVVVVVVLLCAASSRNICPPGSGLFEGGVALFEKCLRTGDLKVCNVRCPTVEPRIKREDEPPKYLHTRNIGS